MKKERRLPFARRDVAVLVPLALFLALAWTGVDFGFHWDEPWRHVRPLKIALERGSMSTGEYIYPGLNVWLNLAALAPDYLASRDLVESVQGRPYLLRARKVRIALTSLAIVWVYLLVSALGRSVPEALLAASLLAFSWEVVYHSRWLAPDSTLMQFAALAVFFAVLAEREPHRGVWTVLAAVAAALACGTKYPGGLALLPVVLVVATRPGLDARRRLKHLVGLALVFAVSFLLTSPAAVLDFRQFKSQLVALKALYGDSWFGYSVESPHLGKLISYLASSALSPFAALAWALFGCAIWGAVRLLSTDRRLAWVLLAFPVAFAAYFSLQKVMIVRNYQVLIPFVAVCAAVGIGDVWRRLPRPGLRVLWTLAVAAAVSYNAVRQAEASRGIRDRADHQAGLRRLDDHLGAHPEVRFFLSERMVEALAFLDARPRRNVVEEASRGTVVVASLRELGAELPANRGLLEWFGPREVDLDRYPTWEGQDRPVTLPMEEAVGVQLALSQLVRRKVVFAARPAHPREALFLAGDERAGDQLYVETTPRGAAVFGLESWGEGRAPPVEGAERGPRGSTDPELRVEPGASHLLEIDWGVARGELRVTLDGRLVFSHYGPLHRARLGELRVGAAAALPGRGAAPFSGTVEPADDERPWRPLAPSAADPRRLVLAGEAGHALPGHALPGHAQPGHAQPGHALPATLWEAASDRLETRRTGGSLEVLTPRERFAAAARYGPLVLPVDGEYLLKARFEAEARSVLGPLWDEAALAFGVLSEDGGRWLAFERTVGRISEWDPDLTIRVFASAGQTVWLVALNDPPLLGGATRLTLGELQGLVRSPWPSPSHRVARFRRRLPAGVW